ncbi:hypothetical protein EMIHUDRAFT_220357 [Emiliania huxleyi CCMP1516]|uniref:Uncharacterized protein n=2 Tax=Emiliania huxleyi TaxID=2903 RepID=A0A0D3I1S7_EMIH1|nr:hypothetical protein EMIHUDRAFT_220357 [Emiliania huxleyi CCMP1516]EOD05212.1 hypothetical protein EMIHUDRAFT_220357 [Emiliania huxleyi CCMP1516]|eukprot:XP_005757641.1 hypothetical protein EMIHUDRAFT_220357 [Emiliania huxleyi CCMP1516]
MPSARGVGGVREGAWVRRAPAGSGSGRHVEEWGCWRLERRGEPLCCAADSPSSEPARGGEPRPVSLVPLATVLFIWRIESCLALNRDAYDYYQRAHNPSKL